MAWLSFAKCFASVPRWPRARNLSARVSHLCNRISCQGFDRSSQLRRNSCGPEVRSDGILPQPHTPPKVLRGFLSSSRTTVLEGRALPEAANSSLAFSTVCLYKARLAVCPGHKLSSEVAGKSGSKICSSATDKHKSLQHRGAGRFACMGSGRQSLLSPLIKKRPLLIGRNSAASSFTVSTRKNGKDVSSRSSISLRKTAWVTSAKQVLFSTMNHRRLPREPSSQIISMVLSNTSVRPCSSWAPCLRPVAANG